MPTITTTHQASLFQNFSARSLERFAPYALALLRIAAGLLFLEAGVRILFAFPEPAPIPPEMQTISFIAGVMELVGGALLIIGRFTRLTGFILSGMMAVGYFMVHAPMSFFPSINMGGEAILYSFIFLYLTFAGPGAWSLDGLNRD